METNNSDPSLKEEDNTHFTEDSSTAKRFWRSLQGEKDGIALE